VAYGLKCATLVLPPIPTTGLTSADVNDLVDRVRDQMLETLRDISVKVHPRQPDPGFPSASVSESSKPPASSSTMMTSVEARTTSTDPVAPESLETIVHSESCANSEASNRKRDESENGAETEEDEGMVLVGRPL
jgi:lysophosphatidate acyltransferase